MFDAVGNWLFDPAGLTPHGFCLLWQPGLLWLHAISDLVIGLAYLTIPLSLIAFIRYRPDLVFRPVFGLFAAFILLCGAGHMLDMLTLWVPAYGIEGIVKALTAAVSVVTAVALWWLMPRALALEATVTFLARHDPLTRLPNRVLFREQLEQAVAASQRGAYFALLCVDLDNFKAINDTLGHHIGDGLLQAVATRLRECCRKGDTVARLGGDEFAVIQLAVEQPGEAQALANRIVAACRDPFDIDGHPVAIGASIGVAWRGGNGASSETLLKNADIALYLAKTAGRGQVRLFEPQMDAHLLARRTLEADLHLGIVRQEFELYFQPVIGLEIGKIAGFEALLRWHHPTRGLVSPKEFIPVAEETGTIVAIGKWVLQAACFEAENWPPAIGVAVNLSAVQFRDSADLVASVRAALDASGLRPERLELEITETVLLRDTAGTLAALHALRAMGISIALDDFGTGHASLGYLRSFPFDRIKIDQSFVRDMQTNAESLSIVRAIAGLAQSLRMRTTAEGVETIEQLHSLRREGCTDVQGFFFSRPRPANELPSLIESLQHIGQVSI